MWIIHLLYIDRSYEELPAFSLNWAEYCNRMFLWIIHLPCIHSSYNELNISVYREQNIRIKSSLEFFICRIFIDPMTNSQFFLRNEQHFRIESWCNELLTCRVFVDHVINSKFLFGIEQDNPKNLLQNFSFDMWYTVMLSGLILSFQIITIFE